MIVKVNNLKKDTNRLIGFFRVNEHDFTKTFPNGATKAVVVPNDNFYRKFRKNFRFKWLPEFGYQILNPRAVEKTLENYTKKIEFCKRQQNNLKTLSSQENGTVRNNESQGTSN